MNTLIGKNIKELLRKKSLTQKELADKLKISESRLSRYLSGEREIKHELLAEIASVLEITTDFLMGIEIYDFNFPRIRAELFKRKGLFTDSEKKELFDILYDNSENNIINISDRRKEEIKTAVAFMYNYFSITEIPINYNKICKNKNIKLLPYSDFEFEITELLLQKNKNGFFCNSGLNNYKIYYNDNLTQENIYFTIIHELSHAFLQHTENNHLAVKEANVFTVYAIAPFPIIKELNIKDSEQLKLRFNINPITTNYIWNNYQNWLIGFKGIYKEYEHSIINTFFKKK